MVDWAENTNELTNLHALIFSPVFPCVHCSLPSLGEASKQQLDSVRSGYSYRNGYYTQPALHTNADTSWTVFGVLRNQHQLSARQYGSSRLW